MATIITVSLLIISLSFFSISNQWVQSNVAPFYHKTLIRYLLVGNELISSTSPDTWHHIVPAMQRIKTSLTTFRLHKVKVGTPCALDVLESSFPPSNGTFRNDIAFRVMKPMLKCLSKTKSFFFLDVYPFFAWSSDPKNIDLNYALFESKTITMVDAVYFAMNRIGYPDIRIFIAETGWPNGGNLDQIGANIHNAATYNRNLIPALPPAEDYKGKAWCVVAEGANVSLVAAALSYACSQGNGTCDPIQRGQLCFEPNSVVGHANYAFSSYWAQFRSIGGTCNFNGLAEATSKDPSYGSCKFQV
ncbi:putative glucan endo-1,3-beta-glucosidase [Arachis hypogaea]|nr:putative glucan endo-1,3-beta-glucosidase [Arachis hypogaea]